MNGPILKTDALRARLQLDQLEFKTLPKGSPTGAPATRTVEFHNEGPIVAALDHSKLQIEHLRILGPRTTISAAGGMDLADAKSPLSMTP